MTQLKYPANETERIEALKRYNILDTPPDGSFDKITRLASTIFNVPIALITLVDTDRIWFKSAFGLGISQINRDPGLCASAILSNEAYIVENAIEDPRTLNNALVAGEFGLRFYAAVPLQTHDNHNLGNFCIIDKMPRTFSADEIEILQQLSSLVMEEMNLRLAIRDTVHKIKSVSSDITSNLKNTIKKMEGAPKTEQSAHIVPYLQASQIFLENLQHHLEIL